MPRGDRTGPNGMGSRSGRGLGYCTGNAVPGYMSDGDYGYGAGCAFGRGRGGRCFGRRFGFGRNYGYAGVSQAYSETEERSFLQREVDNIKNLLTGYEKRLSELNKQSDS